MMSGQVKSDHGMSSEVGGVRQRVRGKTRRHDDNMKQGH